MRPPDLRARTRALRAPRAFSALALLAGLPAFVAGGIVACSPVERPDWTDQLHADSPCYRVNLMDGLDESSTTEVHDLFACIDHDGQFDSLKPTDASLDEADPEAVAAGVDVARTVNALPDAGVDPFALAGVAVNMLRDEDKPVDRFLGLFLEMTYGTSASRVRGQQVLLTSPDALKGGVLAPLAPVIPVASKAMIDDDLETARFVGDLLKDPETKRWIRTFGAYTESNDGRVSKPVAALVPDLGRLIQATRSPGNDHYDSATGDSLRDVARVMATGDDPLISQISGQADAMLGDVKVRTKLADKLVSWQTSGKLADVPAEAAWLASVDVDGNSLDHGEISGLGALIRLLHDTNRPMKCSFDLWVTNLDIDLGNLAVTILEVLADQDPDTVQTGVGLLGSILDWDLSDAVLNDVADSEVCPVLTEQVVSDLHSIDLIQDDREKDLLTVFIDTLNVLKNGEDDHIPDLADAATTLEDADGREPVEELIRDVADEPAIDDVIALVPVLDDPAKYGITAGEEPAVDLQDALSLAIWIFHPGDDGRTGWDRVGPLMAPVLDQDGTWVAVGNASNAMTADGSETGRIVELVPPLLSYDPDLATLDAIAPLLGDDRVAMPVLELMGTKAVPGALLATVPQGEDPEVPLAFGSRLIVDGTIDEVLNMVDILFDALDGLVSEDDDSDTP